MIRSCVILGVAFLVAVTEGVQYLGCFRERSLDYRLLNGDVQNFVTTNSHEVCVNHCLSRGFLFAGVEFGRQCFCSNERPSYEWQANSEDECNMPCSGNPRQVCGAHMRLGVYSLADPAPRPTYAPAPAPKPLRPAVEVQSFPTSYVGCHASGALREVMAQSEGLSLEACKDFCEGSRYRYFGASGGTNCFCGNDIVNSRIDERECRVPCNGVRSQLCGGLAGQLSVYRTSILVQVVYPTTPTYVPRYTEPAKKPKKNKKSSSSGSGSSSSEDKKNKKKKKSKH